jgi:hypothetical protein
MQIAQFNEMASFLLNDINKSHFVFFVVKKQCILIRIKITKAKYYISQKSELKLVFWPHQHTLIWVFFI